MLKDADLIFYSLYGSPALDASIPSILFKPFSFFMAYISYSLRWILCFHLVTIVNSFRDDQ